tara:strand:+ start:379 stop:663 length:285 start_codon:yes stop_codon:yes gene_type:complete
MRVGELDDLSVIGACGHPVECAHLPSMATGHDDPIVCADCFCPHSRRVEAWTPCADDDCACHAGPTGHGVTVEHFDGNAGDFAAWLARHEGEGS